MSWSGFFRQSSSKSFPGTLQQLPCMVRIHSTLQLKDIASGSENSLCEGHLGHLLRITAVAIEDPQRLHSSQQKDTYKKQISADQHLFLLRSKRRSALPCKIRTGIERSFKLSSMRKRNSCCKTSRKSLLTATSWRFCLNVSATETPCFAAKGMRYYILSIPFSEMMDSMIASHIYTIWYVSHMWYISMKTTKAATLVISCNFWKQW